MDIVLYTAVGIMYLSVGMNILRSPGRNTVFNKRPIEVVDEKNITACAACWCLALELSPR